MPARIETARNQPRPSRAAAGRLVMSLLAGVLLPMAAGSAAAQEWPHGGVMPNVGAMSYDLMLSQAWRPTGMRMTGHATTAGGIERWLHCLQPSLSPLRVCQLRIAGTPGGAFLLPPQIDLQQWLARNPGANWVERRQPRFGPSGSFEMSGRFRLGEWTASGRFRYWR